VIPAVAGTPSRRPPRGGCSFDLDGRPPGANAKGAPLHFTVVWPSAAIEAVSPLD